MNSRLPDLTRQRHGDVGRLLVALHVFAGRNDHEGLLIKTQRMACILPAAVGLATQCPLRILVRIGIVELLLQVRLVLM